MTRRHTGWPGDRASSAGRASATIPEAMKALVRDRLQRRLSAPRRIGCAYRLAACSAAPGFDAAAWLPGDIMARFFEPS